VKVVGCEIFGLEIMRRTDELGLGGGWFLHSEQERQKESEYCLVGSRCGGRGGMRKRGWYYVLHFIFNIRGP